MRKKLTDMCTIQYGYAFDSKEFTDNSNFPQLVRIRDVKRGYSETFFRGKYSLEYIIHTGDLLIGMDGEFNIARWRSGDALLNQRVCKVTVKEDVDEEYLRFSLSRALKQIENRTSFVIVKHLSTKELNSLELECPNIQKQKEISDRLVKIEEIISLRQQQLAKLDELVKARFVEMFGDVIHNDKKWKEYRFSDITSSRLGKMLDAKQQTGKHSFPYLANANVQWFRFETDNLNRMDFNEAEQVEFSLKDGDLLVCEGGEIGRCAVWHNQVQSCYFQKALHRVRCNQEIILPDYLAWWFKFNCENNGFAAIEGAKATIAHLPGAKLKQLLVVVPPIERQYRFVDFIEQTDVVKVTVQKSLEQMETLKKALMQQYFG